MQNTVFSIFIYNFHVFRILIRTCGPLTRAIWTLRFVENVLSGNLIFNQSSTTVLLAVTLVARTIEPRSIYDARLTDEEVAERQKARETSSP